MAIPNPSQATRRPQRALALTLFGAVALLWPVPGHAQGGEPGGDQDDRRELEEAIRAFNLWSDLGLYARREYHALPGDALERLERERSEMKRLLSPDCRVVLTHEGLERTLSRDEFTQELGQIRFMWAIQETVLDGPRFAEEGGRTMATLRKHQTDSEGNAVVIDERLAAERAEGRWVITEVQRTSRPADEDANREAAARRAGEPYNPYRGLGARYLGGGCFGGSGPSWSPDGQRIVFASLRHESSEIYVMDRDGSGLTRLTETEYWEGYPSFTPDGRIVYLCDRESPAGEPYVMESDGTNARRLVPGLARCSLPTFACDGSWFAFTAPVGGHTQIFRMSRDGSDPVCLTRGDSDAYSPIISPDGSQIAFVQSSQALIVTHADGSAPVEIDRVASGSMHLIDFAGDGERILYVRAEEGGEIEIWTASTNGTERTRLRALPAGFSLPFLAPDGSSMICISDRIEPYQYEIYAMPLEEGGEPVQLTHERGYISGVSFSPDGRHLLILAAPQGGESQGRGRICVMRGDGSELTTVGTNH